MKRIIILALAGLATLALPLAAGAKPPSADGQKPAGKHGAKSKRCAKPKRVGFVAAGPLVAVDQSSLTVGVERGNRHARRWLEDNDAVFDVDGLTVGFAGVVDGDASGTVDLADVLAGDRVRVVGKLSLPKRGCDGEATLSLRKVKVSREAPVAPDGETGAGETGGQTE